MLHNSSTRDMEAATAALSAALADNREHSLDTVRQAIFAALADIYAACRISSQSTVIRTAASVEAALKALLTSPLPLFTTPVLHALSDAYLAIFLAGDSRGVRPSCTFLLKHATTAQKQPAGPHSSRVAALHVLGSLSTTFGATIAADATDTCTTLLKFVASSADKSGSASLAPLRAAACRALRGVVEGLGSRQLPQQAATGSGKPSAGQVATSKLHSTVMAHCASTLRDPCPSVRATVGPTLTALATGSAGFCTVPGMAMELLRIATDGVCDPHPLPRFACALALSSILATSVLATRVGAVAAEAAAVANRMAALRGTDSDDEGEDDGQAGGDRGRADDGAEGMDAGEGAAGDGSSRGDGSTAGGAGASGGASAPAFLSSVKRLGQGLGGLGQQVKKAAQAAGKQLADKAKESSERSSDGAGVASSAADAAAAAAATTGAVGQGSGNVLKQAIAQVASVGKKGKRLRAVSFTVTSALVYLLNLMRSAGSLATKRGCRAGDVRAAVAIAGASVLRSVRGAAGGTQDEEYMAAVEAVCECLADTSVTSSLAVSGGCAAVPQGVPELDDVSVVAGGLPPSGPHTAHLMRCAVFVLQHGMLDRPPVPGAVVPSLWSTCQAGMMDRLLALGAVWAAARVSRGRRRSIIADEAADGDAAGKGAVMSPDTRAGRGPGLRLPGRLGKLPGSAGLKRITSRMTFRSPKGAGRPPLGKAAAGTTGAADQPRRPIPSERAMCVVLSVLQATLPQCCQPDSEGARDRGVELARVALVAATTVVSHALRLQAARCILTCCLLCPSLLHELVPELLGPIRRCLQELSGSEAQAALVAAAAAGAMADAHMLAARRRAGKAPPPGTGAACVMVHMGTSADSASEGGFGVPGAGSGSGCGVLTKHDAARARCLHGTSLCLSLVLGCIGDVTSTTGECPVQATVLEDVLSTVGSLLVAGTTEGPTAQPVAALIPGQATGTSPVALLVQSAAAASSAELSAACLGAASHLVAGLSHMPTSWLAASEQWLVLQTGLARGLLATACPLPQGGIGSAKEGTGAFGLAAAGLPGPATAVASLLSSSSTAASAGPGAASQGAGQDSGMADAAGVGTARSLYSGVAGAWGLHGLASVARGILALTRATAQGNASSSQALQSMARMVRLGLTCLTACPIVPASLVESLRSAPDRARARLMREAAESLLTRPDPAAVVSFGPDCDPSAPAPDISVRGLPYTWEDACLYSPSGVSLTAVALARRSVLEAAADLLEASAIVTDVLEPAVTEPLRGPAMSCAVTLASQGTAGLVPLELGMVAVDMHQADSGSHSPVDHAATGWLPSLSSPGLEPSDWASHDGAVSSALAFLTSRPGEDTWSPLALAAVGGVGRDGANDSVVSPSPAAVDDADVSELVAAAEACGYSSVSNQAAVPAHLRPVLDPGQASLHGASEERALVMGMAMPHRPALGKAVGLVAQHRLSSDPAQDTVQDPVALGLGAFLPSMPGRQAQLLATALAAILQHGASSDSEHLPTVGYRLAQAAHVDHHTRASVQQGVARALLSVLASLLPEEVLEEGKQPGQTSSSTGSSSSSSSAGHGIVSPPAHEDDEVGRQQVASGKLAASVPVAWLAAIRSVLPHLLSSPDPQLQYLSSCCLGQVVRLSGPLHGRKLLLSVQKQLKVLRSEAVAAAAVSVSASGNAGDAQAINKTAHVAAAGAALALGLMCREAAHTTVLHDKGVRMGTGKGGSSKNLLVQLYPRLPLTLVTSALEPQLLYETARDAPGHTRTAALTGWAMLLEGAVARARAAKTGPSAGHTSDEDPVSHLSSLLPLSLSLLECHMVHVGEVTRAGDKACLRLSSRQGAIEALGHGRDAFTAESARVRAWQYSSVSLDQEGALSASWADGTAAPTALAALHQASASSAAVLPMRSALLVTDGDLRVPSNTVSLDSACAQDTAMAVDAAVLSVAHPNTGELLPPVAVLTAGETAIASRGNARQASSLAAGNTGDASPSSGAGTPTASSPVVTTPRKDSSAVAAVRALRASVAVLHTRVGQSTARAMAQSVVQVLANGGSAALDPTAAEGGHDHGRDGALVTVLCLIAREVAKAVEVLAGQTPAAGKGAKSLVDPSVCLRLLPVLAGVSNLGPSHTAAGMLMEAAQSLGQAMGQPQVASGNSSVNPALAAMFGRAVCTGPSAVHALSASVEPLPEVTGARLQGLVLPLPSGLGEDPQAKGVSQATLLYGRWLALLHGTGLSLVQPDGRGVDWTACPPPSTTSTRMLALCMAPCGLATSESTALTPSPQFLAGSVMPWQASGRPLTSLCPPPSGRANITAVLASIAGAVAMSLSTVRVLANVLPSLIGAWASCRSRQASPGYHVSLGCLGDVLLALDRAGSGAAGADAGVAGLIDTCVSSMVRACAAVVSARPGSLADICGALADAVTGQRTVSHENSGRFQDAVRAAAAQPKDKKGAKGGASAGGDFGPSGSTDEADEEAGGAGAEEGGGHGLHPAILALDTDAARAALLTDSLSLATLFDTGLWRALGPVGKTVAARVAAGLLGSIKNMPQHDTHAASGLLAAACFALSSDGASSSGRAVAGDASRLPGGGAAGLLSGPGEEGEDGDLDLDGLTGTGTGTDAGTSVGPDGEKRTSALDKDRDGSTVRSGVQDGDDDDVPGQGLGRTAAAAQASQLRLAGASLLLSLLRSCHGLPDPDVPGTHGLAQYSATLTAALVPALDEACPVALLRLSCETAVLAVQSGVLGDTGSLRRILKALVPAGASNGSHPGSGLNSGHTVRLAALARIVAVAAWQPPAALFERSLPSYLRDHKDKLQSQPVPPEFTASPGQSGQACFRLSLPARAAVSEAVGWHTVARMVDTALALSGTTSDGGGQAVTSHLLHASCAIIMVEGSAPIVPIGAPQRKGGTAAVGPDEVSTMANAVRLALSMGQAGALCLALCHPKALDGLSPSQAAAARQLAASHQAWTNVNSSKDAGSSSGLAATPLAALAAIAERVGTDVKDSDVLLRHLRSWKLGGPGQDTELVSHIRRLAKAVMEQAKTGKPDAEQWLALLVRMTVALGSNSTAEPSLLEELGRAIVACAAKDGLDGLAVDQCIRDCTQTKDNHGGGQAWAVLGLPLALAFPQHQPSLASALAGLVVKDAESVTTAGRGDQALVSVFGLEAGAAIIRQLVPEARSILLRACATALHLLYGTDVIVKAGSGSGMAAQASTLAQACGVVMCRIAQADVATSTAQPSLLVSLLLSLCPLLFPGRQLSLQVDSGWLTAQAQKAVAVEAVATAKAAPAFFKSGLSALAAPQQTELQESLRSGLAGSRRDTDVKGATEESGAVSSVQATSGSLRAPGVIPSAIAATVAPAAAPTVPSIASSAPGLLGGPGAGTSGLGGGLGGGGLKLSLSKFKAPGATAGAGTGLKPPSTTTAAPMDVSSFLSGDDDFTRALRARAARAAGGGGGDEEDEDNEDGPGQGAPPPDGEDGDHAGYGQASAMQGQDED